MLGFWGLRVFAIIFCAAGSLSGDCSKKLLVLLFANFVRKGGPIPLADHALRRLCEHWLLLPALYIMLALLGCGTGDGWVSKVIPRHGVCVCVRHCHSTHTATSSLCCEPNEWIDI